MLLNFWRLEFYNAIQSKDWDGFVSLLLLYRYNDQGPDLRLHPIGDVARGDRGVRGLSDAMADDPLAALDDGTVSARMDVQSRLLQDHAPRAQPRIGTDNPDQRITEDIRDLRYVAVADARA